VFGEFIKGATLEECYEAVGLVADRWWDILEYEGAGLSLSEIIDYVGEKRVISKSLSEYGTQKSTAITCARRLAELLGGDIVVEKGLNCHMLISKKPIGDPVSERAIPAVIFQVEPEVRKKFLRMWTKENTSEDLKVQDVIDWAYYKERLGACIQKIITIPASLQRMPNPNPRIP
jgi:DNA polymerase epsilon subunit 1